MLSFRNTCSVRGHGHYATWRADGGLDRDADGVRPIAMLRNAIYEGRGSSFVSVISATKAMADWTCRGKATLREPAAFEAGDLTIREKAR